MITSVAELTINGVSCLQSLEYHSSRKLVCLRPNAPGTGDIVVNTFSGGSGTCTVQITIQQPEVKQLLGKSKVHYHVNLDVKMRSGSLALYNVHVHVHT